MGSPRQRQQRDQRQSQCSDQTVKNPTQTTDRTIGRILLGLRADPAIDLDPASLLLFDRASGERIDFDAELEVLRLGGNAVADLDLSRQQQVLNERGEVVGSYGDEAHQLTRFVGFEVIP